MPWLAPDYATPDGRLKMTVHALIVETPTRRILVDTCIGNAKAGRSVPAWNGLETPFLSRMIEAGYPPEMIDTVLCTHLHVDHVGWNTTLIGGAWQPTFPNARYVFGRTEYDYWRDHSVTPEQIAVFADSVQPVVDAQLVDFVASDHRLSDEITLIPTPGHSAGHVSVHIESNGAHAVLTGDVAHHPCQMARLDWSSDFDSDPAQSAATRRALFSRFADTGTLIVGGHFGAGYLTRHGNAFRLTPAG